MQYTIYADRLLFLHFSMNVLLMLLTGKIGQYRIRQGRLLGAAFLGAVLFLLIFLLPMGRVWGFKSFLFAAVSAAALQLAFCFQNRKSFLEAGFLYIAMALTLGGALSAVYGISRSAETVGSTVFSVLLPAAASAAGLSGLMVRIRKRRKNPYWTVTLIQKEKRITLQALMDSGNSLYDPISHRAVCIVEREIPEKLGLTEPCEKMYLIPFHSIGKKHGLLQAVAVEKMYLIKESRAFEKENVLLAVYTEKLSATGLYQMLLHPALLEERKGKDHDFENCNAGKDAV